MLLPLWFWCLGYVSFNFAIYTPPCLLTPLCINKSHSNLSVHLCSLQFSTLSTARLVFGVDCLEFCKHFTNGTPLIRCLNLNLKDTLGYPEFKPLQKLKQATQTQIIQPCHGGRCCTVNLQLTLPATTLHSSTALLGSRLTSCISSATPDHDWKRTVQPPT